MNSEIQCRIPEEERNADNGSQLPVIVGTPLHTVYWDWHRAREESSFFRTNLPVNHAPYQLLFRQTTRLPLPAAMINGVT